MHFRNECLCKKAKIKMETPNDVVTKVKIGEKFTIKTPERWTEKVKGIWFPI